MESLPYLIFSVKGALYGVEALSVKEVFLLPEVTPIAATPPTIVGVINLRGEILPIVDVNIRLGSEVEKYSLTDSVIVLESRDFLSSEENNDPEKKSQIGIIVNEVFEVKNIPLLSISKEVYAGGDGIKLVDSKDEVKSDRFLSGVARVEDDIVMLLSSTYLIRYLEIPSLDADNLQDSLAEKKAGDKKIIVDQKKSLLFASKISPEERPIFRERSKSLKELTLGEDFTGLMPLAVIGLNEEYFGINLEVVREFTDVHKITPIPCTPTHIVGNMNLRGEIVTLVDLRGLLNMPMRKVENFCKAMIIEVADMVAAVIVEEVFDVMYLNPTDLKAIPAAVHSNNSHEEYLIGTAKYRQTMMSIVDLPKIMMQGGLVVEEYT